MNTAFLLTTLAGAGGAGGRVDVPPELPPVLSATMSRSKDGNQFAISWVGGGILQSADQVTGPWTDVDGATSPYLTPMRGPQRFYRVRLP